MPQVLGIDLGTGSTAAAMCSLDEPGAPPAPLPVVPTVLGLPTDGSVHVGRRGSGPHATGFVERIGDPVPQLVGGRRFLPQDLAATLVGWLVDRATERAGPLARVAVTHPGDWGPYRRGLLASALADNGVDDVLLLPAPSAAAALVSAPGPLVVGELGCGHARATVLAPGDRVPLGHARSPEPLVPLLDDALAALVLAEAAP
ncbi:MAG TPA: hypothetical protein VGD67_27060, partial [Pseudonocardiaceae bacterium]